MLEMIMLHNGMWIDPNAPVSVKVEYNEPGLSNALPCWTVVIANNGIEHRVDFVEQEETARHYADGIGRQVNRERKRDRYAR